MIVLQWNTVVRDGTRIERATALWVTADAGHLDLLAFLLTAGANVNARTPTNSTPLRVACFCGHIEVLLSFSFSCFNSRFTSSFLLFIGYFLRSTRFFLLNTFITDFDHYQLQLSYKYYAKFYGA